MMPRKNKTLHDMLHHTIQGILYDVALANCIFLLGGLGGGHVVSLQFSLNDISHAHVPRIILDLQTSPPKGQETSARVQLKTYTLV